MKGKATRDHDGFTGEGKCEGKREGKDPRELGLPLESDAR